MNRKSSIFSPTKLRSNKKEIAVIGLYFDVFDTNLFTIPILPLPIRVDKVTNEEPTCFVHPNLDKLNEISKALGLTINYETYFLFGIKNFINYAKETYKSITYRSLPKEFILRWYENSISTVIEIPSLIKDYTFIISEFLKTYSTIENLKVSPEEDRYFDELIRYCERMVNYFKNALESNSIRIKINQEIKEEKIYTERKNKYYPIPVYIDVSYGKDSKLKKRVLIPYLIYDDLIDVFFYNHKMLVERKKNPINLKIYENNGIIIKGQNTKYYHHKELIEKLYKFTYTDLMKIL